MRLTIALLIPLLLLGCGHPAAPPSAPAPTAAQTPPHAKGPGDPWLLTCTDPNDPEAAVLENGLIGIRIGRDGTGTKQSFLKADAYQSDGEEKIKLLPNPLSFKTSLDYQSLDPRKGTGYFQQLDMRTGILTTRWAQRIDNTNLVCQSETVVDPYSRAVAQRWLFQSESRIPIRQEWLNPLRDGPFESHRFAGDGRTYTFNNGSDGGTFSVEAREVSGMGLPSTAPRQWYQNAMATGPNEPVVFEWAINYPKSYAPRLEALEDFKEIARRSRDAWAKRWQTDIQIDGPPEDQQAMHSFLFYLRSAINPQSPNSIAPFALSNQTYNGHVFWDADTWVFPALALIDPDEAKAITNFRLKTLEGAMENAKTAKKKGEGLRYAWESGPSGRETAPSPTKDEIHASGDVAWCADQAASLGLEKTQDAEKIRNDVAAYYNSISEPGPQGREIKGVLSADEYFLVDNDLYTNLLAQWTANHGTWNDQTKYKLPKDDKSFLTYDNDEVRAYKQAAAILSIYPLQYPPAEAEAAQMMARFPPKVSPNGPAMSNAINAIVRARLNQNDKAYDDWQRSWQPYTNHPLMLFSEKAVKSPTYFTTGAAGAIQAVLYGFLGFRLDYRKEPGAAWSTPLLDGKRWLSIKPHLPSAWKSVKFTNFTILGRRYTLTVTPTSTKITPVTSPGGDN